MYGRDDAPETLFEKEEIVIYEGEQAKVIAEYQRTICIELLEYPIEDKEEEFPFHRLVIKKDECERTAS
ncbi:hypothetical protein ACFPU1_06500 [Thalassorhabdus alkalitolerans]|uniref:Uncharacterized protein n=1 Tax=Thalassorhabdus alkalitolerans TaxID=2282697 RepID=A0ABW0YPY4_9BACI|nr:MULTISPECIES: hypothetical protein [Bacillaceae]